MFGSTIMLFICSIFSKILGFVRELVVAYKYGAGPITDAFIITNNIPTIFFSALAMAIAINYVPIAVGIDKKEQDKFTSNLINISLVVLVLGIIVMLLAPNIVLNLFAAGMKAETREYALVMLNVTVFAAVPMVLSYIFQAYLQVRNYFLTTGISSVIINIVVIAFTQISTKESFYLLSIGTVLSNVVALGMLWINSRMRGYRHKWKLSVKDEHFKLLVVLTLPLLAETITSNINVLVDKNMASFLDTGTMTGLNYAGNLSNMAYAMVVTSIITVVFPRFSKFAADDKLSDLKREFTFFGDILIMILIPIGVFMCLMSGPIVDILFKRGAFDSTAAVITSQSLAFYAPGLFFAGMQTYVVRAFYALKDTKTPTMYAIFALGINIGLNFLFIGSLQHMGLALATTLARGVSYGLLLYKLRKKINMTMDEVGIFHALKVGGCAIVSCLVIMLLYKYQLVQLNKYVSFILSGVLFLLLYGFGLIVIKFQPLRDCIGLLRKRGESN